MMAAWIDVFIERLVIARDLRIMGIELDQRIGRVAGVPIAGGEVLENKPVRESYPAGYPAGADDEEAETTCPDCAGELIHGYDVLDEAEGEVEIVFCAACGFRMRLADFEAEQADTPEATMAAAL